MLDWNAESGMGVSGITRFTIASAGTDDRLDVLDVAGLAQVLAGALAIWGLSAFQPLLIGAAFIIVITRRCGEIGRVNLER